MEKFYMQVEAVNLSQFVYDTHDISTIRGGSFLLLEAIEGLAAAFEGRLTQITAAASRGIFSLLVDKNEDAPEEFVDKLMTDVLQHLQDVTDSHATFLVAVEKDEGVFPSILERLTAQIRRQQWRMPTVQVPMYGGAAKECFIDGWRPGTKPYRGDPGITDEKISEATWFRRERGIQFKHKLFSTLLGDRDYEYDDALCAKDLEALTTDDSKGVLSGRMAYIHIDGNSFGRIRKEQCDSEETLKKFDDVIQESCRKPFLRALLERAGGDADFQTVLGTNRALRLEVLLWGGDEMTIVVPAWKGLETLRLFYDHAKSLPFGDVALTHRAVMVLCHHNAPILQIRKIADDLLDRTKDDIGATPPDGGPLDHVRGDAMHFLSLESFDMLQGDLGSFIREYYKDVTYSHLLLHAHELSDVFGSLEVIRQNVAQGRVIEAGMALRRTGVEGFDKVMVRLYETLPGGDRAAVKAAVEHVLAGDPTRWYLVTDLWDYLSEWGA
ncbi:MAG: hypothetical protein KBG20_13485 [Caldilineaceae bacterium]|nr:hypothetical protein [Caldilineaceae bacterium]MBP8123421.1 hypothetical protein [Caldilineaceae bacterium]MBP9073311.1 hypothetical protein [Caldilineaceae bacterium]